MRGNGTAVIAPGVWSSRRGVVTRFVHIDSIQHISDSNVHTNLILNPLFSCWRSVSMFILVDSAELGYTRYTWLELRIASRTSLHCILIVAVLPLDRIASLVFSSSYSNEAG